MPCSGGVAEGVERRAMGYRELASWVGMEMFEEAGNHKCSAAFEMVVGHKWGVHVGHVLILMPPTRVSCSGAGGRRSAGRFAAPPSVRLP
jgi:hypothetical protein